MKHRFLITTFCTLLFALASCGEKKPGTYPSTNGDFVEISDGRGTAQVWGIDFSVADPLGGHSGSQFEGWLHSDPEQTNARVDISLGDDVNIRLEKVPGKPIALQVNGKGYGALQVGDSVAIDKERSVTVNGTIRQPSDVSP